MRRIKIEPPTYLDTNAKQEFARIVAALQAEGSDLRQVDIAYLATYAAGYSGVRQLTLRIRSQGDVTAGYRGRPRKNPNFPALRENYTRMLRAANKLGLCPSARRGMNLTPPSDPANGLSKYRMR